MYAKGLPRSELNIQYHIDITSLLSVLVAFHAMFAPFQRHRQRFSSFGKCSQILNDVCGRGHVGLEIQILIDVQKRLGKPVSLFVFDCQVVWYKLQVLLGRQNGLGIFRQKRRREQVSTRGHCLFIQSNLST